MIYYFQPFQYLKLKQLQYIFKYQPISIFCIFKMEKEKSKSLDRDHLVQKQYKKYLEEVSNKILQVCIQDEALNTLKCMQSKQYLIERINEIITSVYEIQKQNKIVSLVEQIQTYRQIIQENMQNKIQVEKLNTKNNQNLQEAINFQNFKILQEENVELQKQIILQQQEQKFHIRQLNETIIFLKNQNQAIKKDYAQKFAGIFQNFRLLQQKYKSIYEQKTIIQQNFQIQIQRSLKQNLRFKDLQDQNNDLRTQYDKLIKQMAQAQQKQQILNEKIMRIQQTKERYQQQIKNYQNQIKLVKMIQERTIKQQGNGYQMKLEQQVRKIKELEQSQISYNLAQKERKILQLQGQKQKIKGQYSELQMQFHQHRMKCQRQKMQMETNMKNLVLKSQKGLRIAKDQYLKDRQKLLQQYSTKIEEQKQKIKSQLSKQLKEVQQKSQKHKIRQQQTRKQLRSLQLLTQQKQQLYNSSLIQFQQKTANMKSYLKQLQNKISNKNLNFHQIQKQSSLKYQLHEEELKFVQAENTRIKKELQKLKQEVQRTNAKSLITLSSNKNNDSNQIVIKQYQQSIKQLKQNQILLQSQLKYLKKELKSKVDQVAQQKLLNLQINDKLEQYEEKIKRIEKDLAKQKKQIYESQSSHQKQVQDICKKHQIVNSQMKKQLSFHYQQLLRDQQKKIQEIINNDAKTQTKIIIKTLKETIQDLRSKIQQNQEKQHMLNTSKQQLNQQIKRQNKKIEDLQDYVKQQEQKLKIQKDRHKQLVSYYQSKLHLNRTKFKDFKFQFYVALKSALDGVKAQLIHITLSIRQMQNQFHNTIQKLSIHTFKQINSLKIKHAQQIKAQKFYYQNQVILKLEIDKQQITYENQKRNKQKNIEIMTILAEKEYALANLTEKDKLGTKKINQILQNLHLTQQDLQNTRKQNLSFKEVIQKMNVRVCLLQKQKITLNHELKSVIQEKQSLQKQLSQIQNMYMQKLQKCREKYIKQNQKLFSKYEREFDKLIGMNSKNKQLGMGMSSISSILSPEIIPTKEFQKVGKNKKLQNLGKEIQMQKKKLELLQGNKLKKNKSKQKDSGLTNFKRTCNKLTN